MSEEVSLLDPRSRSNTDLAISEGIHDWWGDIPVDILETLWDPARAPADVLPHLARALGIPIWLDRWSLLTKRSVVSRAARLARERGRRITFEEWFSIIDADMVGFTAPPQGLFPRRHWTPEERAAWRAQFPEIRVYPRRNRHSEPEGLLATGRPWFGSRAILRASSAPQHAGHRAVIVENGVTRPVSVRVEGGAGEFARGNFAIRLTTTAPKLMLPAILGRGFIARRSSAARRVYKFADGPGDPDVLPPGVVTDVTPERVREKHLTRGGFFPGGTLSMIVRSSKASDFIYDSVRIYDPRYESIRTGKRGGWILGRSTLRQNPFTIHITVDLSRKRTGGFVVGRKLPMAARAFDPTRINEATAAARAAKLGRDQVLVRTNLHRAITANDSIRADGSHRVGEIIRKI